MEMSFEFYKLNNGVRVMLVPMEGVESVGVGVYVGTGSRYETPRINGISHFLEHMVFKGTKKFPTTRDTSYLEGLGAIQNAWTDVDATCYWSKVPADKWKEGLELAKELALYPTLPEADLEIERGVILEEIHRRDDRPNELAEEEMQKLAFGGNSLGMTILGEPEVIKSISRQDFVEYHQSQYTPGNMVVVIAGKLPRISEARSHILNWFGELKTKEARSYSPMDWKQEKPKIKVVKKKLAAQAHLVLGWKGLNLSDGDRYALSVLTSHLGHGLSSRLFIEVREKRGLCYAINADSQMLEDTGLWSIYAGLASNKLEEAVKAIMEEIKKVREVKLTTKELEQAREKVRGPLLFSKENPIHQMDFYGRQALHRPEEIVTYDEVINRLMALNSDLIQKVAQKIFSKQYVNLTIVGPIEQQRGKKLFDIISL